MKESPCLKCDHHLAGGSKNDRRCVFECDLRLAYPKKVGAMVASMDPEVVKLKKGGIHMPDIEKQLGEIEKQLGESVLSKKEVLAQNVGMPDIEEKTEIDLNLEVSETDKVVYRICEKHLVDLETLRTGSHRRRGSLATAAIQEIVETLANEMNMDTLEIARILNVTPSAVWQRLNKKTKRKKMKKDTKNLKDTPKGECEHCGVGFGELHLPPCVRTAGAALKPADPNNGKNYLLEIDFSKHVEIYEDLIKTAEDRLRKPAGQALWTLKKVYEKGLEAEKET